MPKLALKIGLPIVIGAVVVILLISRGAADSVLSFEWRTTERLLLSAEDAKKAGFSISVSPRGAHVAYVIKEQQSGKDQYRLRLDDRDVGVYSQVWETIFSPDGKRTAFLVSYGAGEGDRFIVDGKEQEKYEVLMPGKAAFSPDGSLFGYQAVKDKSVFIVINGVPGKAYEMVWGIGQRSIAPLVFSANGKHYAYQARRDNKDFVVHDGKEHPVELALDHVPALSPDGARWAVVTSEPIGNNKLAPRVVVDGRPFGKTYHHIANRPVFSPDGKRIAYSPTLRWDPGQDQEGICVVDGKELEPRYEFVRTIVFSPDSKRLAYEAKRRGKFVVVLDGQESKEYDLVRSASLVFSPDSRRFAYRVSSNLGEFIVVDGVEQGPYSMILTPPIFSPDSRHVIYLAASAKEQFAVIDGEARGKYEAASVPDSGTDALRRSNHPIEFEAPQFLTGDSFGYVAKRAGAYYWIEERRVRHLAPQKAKPK